MNTSLYYVLKNRATRACRRSASHRVRTLRSGAAVPDILTLLKRLSGANPMERKDNEAKTSVKSPNSSRVCFKPRRMVSS